MRWSFLACCLAGLASLSVAADEVSYYPLAEGAEWTMSATITLPDGKVVETTGHRKIGAKEERAGKTYYRVKTWIEEFVSFETLDREDVEGIHTIDLREKNPKDALKIPSPLMLGTKWTRDNGKTQISYELIAIEDVTIDGKTYQSCYKIKAEAKDGSHSELAWMAVGLGTIKSDSVWSNGRKLSVTLRDFKIGAP